MRSFVKLAAAAVALAVAAPALAQTTAPADQTTPPAAPAEGAAPAAGAPAAAAPVAAGQPVKDSTGAVIGEVAEVKPDASGKPMATIKMGTDSFAVAVANLAVSDGATLINATQAEIKAMLKK
ncbi:hypothetical protein ASD79_05630 [Caulobacter sp. Root655]|uniref:hypothetical protein n=1 Tax=Caulobacter sp. Root655 TaxID=1736578 RepID=UPI000701BA75|nr:hypothetical protein [Caulobacter sp. Root655]KRA61597.1 hypothetical protein ASD79_05630 [Caulobacter sp. Root655]